MEPFKFREEYTRSGILYYEPANAVADELLDFLRPNNQCCTLNETMAEKIFDWCEKLGHDVQIVQSRDFRRAQGV
jgi:hypothetical protein